MALLAAEPREPLHRTIDLNRGETQQVQFSNGTSAKIKLVETRETHDILRRQLKRTPMATRTPTPRMATGPPCIASRNRDIMS